MNTMEYYMELRFAFPTILESAPISVSTTQISEILHCTLRNTRILLKKMSTEGYIDWTSGKGRGNQSHLTFKLPLASVIILHYQSLIQQNRLDEAIQFLDRKGIPMDIKKKCYHHLRPNFGLHSNHDREQNNRKLPSISKKITLNHIIRKIHNRTSSWMIGKKITKKTTLQWPSQSNDLDI